MALGWPQLECGRAGSPASHSSYSTEGRRDSRSPVRRNKEDEYCSAIHEKDREKKNTTAPSAFVIFFSPNLKMLLIGKTFRALRLNGKLKPLAP